MRYLNNFVILMLAVFCLTLQAEAANRKDELPQRPAIMSVKAAKALLTDVSVFGDRIVAVGERGHILSSSDEGKSWKQGRVPVQVLLTGVALVSEQQGWAIGHEGVILHTNDAGTSWNVQYANPYKAFTEEEMNSLSEEEYNQLPRYGAPLLDIWFKNDKEGFVVGAYGVLLHTRDGGASWDDWSQRLDNDDNWHLNAIGSVDGNTLYIAGEKGVIFVSEDAGATWESRNNAYQGSYFGMLTGPQPEKVLVFGLQGNMLRSEDAGMTWSRLDSPTGNSLMSAVQIDRKTIVITGNSGTLLTSHDVGKTFTLQTTRDRQAIVGIAKTAGGKLVMVGQSGIKMAAPAQVP